MRRLMLFLGVIVIATATASPASSTAPATQVIPIDFSFTPPLLSAACGFTVARHVEGTLTIRTFYDAQGSFTRELDQYQLVETVSANDRTLVGRTIQNIAVTLLADGSFTVAFVGTDFRLPVPGAGIAFGSVGRLLLLFAPDHTLLDVVQDVGDVRSDFATLCQALAPTQPSHAPQ
jgi:hypothetical protein